MAEKHGHVRTRIAGVIAAEAVGFVTRRVIAAMWTRVTGRVPPDDPEDPQVAMGEAISFVVIMGVGTQVARLLATRATMRRLAARLTKSAD
jgi:hypothetical protein